MRWEKKGLGEEEGVDDRPASIFTSHDSAHTDRNQQDSTRNFICDWRDWCDIQPTVPVQLEDDRSVHDGEAQQADPAQEDTAKHAGVEIHDHDLRSSTTSVSAGNRSRKNTEMWSTWRLHDFNIIHQLLGLILKVWHSSHHYHYSLVWLKLWEYWHVSPWSERLGGLLLRPARNKHVAEANLTRHQGKGLCLRLYFSRVWLHRCVTQQDATRQTSRDPREAQLHVLLCSIFFLLEQRWTVFMPRPPYVNPLLYFSFILKHVILDPKQISTDFKVDSSLHFKLPVRCDIVFSWHPATMHTHLEQGESLGVKPRGQTGLEAVRVSSLLSSITKAREVHFNSYFVGMRCVFSLLAEPMLIYLAMQADY